MIYIPGKEKLCNQLMDLERQSGQPCLPDSTVFQSPPLPIIDQKNNSRWLPISLLLSYRSYDRQLTDDKVIKLI